MVLIVRQSGPVRVTVREVRGRIKFCPYFVKGRARVKVRIRAPGIPNQIWPPPSVRAFLGPGA